MVVSSACQLEIVESGCDVLCGEAACVWHEGILHRREVEGAMLNYGFIVLLRTWAHHTRCVAVAVRSIFASVLNASGSQSSA